MSEARTENAVDVAEKPSYPGLVLPVAVSVLVVTLVFFFFGGDAAVELLTTALATATVAGKFVVLRGLHEGGFLGSPYKLAALVVYLDVLVAFIAVYNIAIFYKIPRLGRKIRGMQQNGKAILERNPWMGKLTFLGVVAFVMFPVSGTGAIGGSIFGRLLGMSRVRTLVAIGTGSVIGAFGMAFLAGTLGERLLELRDSPVSLALGILATGGAVWWFLRNARRGKAARQAEAEAVVEEDAGAAVGERGHAVPKRPATERPRKPTTP